MAKVIGNGSIQALEKPEKGCKRWRLRVNTGYDHQTKKYTQRTKTFKGTKTQAQAALRDFITDIESGLKLKRAQTSFAVYADEWLEMRKLSGDISAGTLRKNTTDLKRLKHYIGNISLTDLDAENITRALIQVKTHGGQAEMQLSGTTLNGVYRVLNQVLESARKAKIIPSNPCEDVQAPRKDTKEKEALSRDEARRLTTLLLDGEPEPKTVGFLLALTCGLRREEVCGLCWRDFDPMAKCIRVEHAYSEDECKEVEPKTRSSKRIIPLISETLARLNEWKSMQEFQLWVLGITQTQNTPVVSIADGGHMHPQNFARAWLRYRKHHGFEEYTLHQLRHTFATRLVASGIDLKTAATLMGHSSVNMLERVYAHFVPENAERAIAALSDDLFGESQSVIVPFTDQKSA